MSNIDSVTDKLVADFQRRKGDPQVASIPKARLAAEIRQLFYDARNAKRPMLRRWTRNYHILNNRTWSPYRPDYLPTPEVPEIYPIIATIAAWETDQRTTFEVSPAAAPFSPYYQFYDSLALDLKSVLDSIWVNEHYDAELEKGIWDANVYGTAIFKMVWDNNLAGGLGNPALIRCDPYTVYPDPNAKSDRDMNYIQEVRTISYQEMERRWPGSIKKLGDGGYIEESPEAPTQLGTPSPTFPRANPGAISPATSPRYGLPGQSRLSVFDKDEGVTIIETWLRTPVKIDYPGLADTELGAERHYDTWRYVVVAGNVVIMDDMAENLWSHGQHPYVRYVPHDLGEFWGFSMVELLTPSQLSINRLLAAIEQNIWLMGNPVFKESTRAGIGRTQITNKPGQRLMVNNQEQAEWLQPPQMHPTMSGDLIRFYIGEMERISGLSAIVRGATPTGRNAQGVLDSVQEAAFVRIRAALRNLERCLSQLGNLAASLVAEFYDSPRIVAIVGPSGERTSLALHSYHFYLPSDDGRVPMRFQLIVDAGSSLPTSPQARSRDAETLYALGAIDEEALLEAKKWPNRHIITQRVREMKAATGTLGQPPTARAASGRQR